jgi:hypothetical protein
LKWRAAGAAVARMADVRALALRQALPTRAVLMGEIPGRSGTLAVQGAPARCVAAPRASS